MEVSRVSIFSCVFHGLFHDFLLKKQIITFWNFYGIQNKIWVMEQNAFLCFRTKEIVKFFFFFFFRYHREDRRKLVVGT